MQKSRSHLTLGPSTASSHIIHSGGVIPNSTSTATASKKQFAKFLIPKTSSNQTQLQKFNQASSSIAILNRGGGHRPASSIKRYNSRSKSPNSQRHHQSQAVPSIVTGHQFQNNSKKSIQPHSQNMIPSISIPWHTSSSSQSIYPHQHNSNSNHHSARGQFASARNNSSSVTKKQQGQIYYNKNPQVESAQTRHDSSTSPRFMQPTVSSSSGNISSPSNIGINGFVGNSISPSLRNQYINNRQIITTSNVCTPQQQLQAESMKTQKFIEHSQNTFRHPGHSVTTSKASNLQYINKSKFTAHPTPPKQKPPPQLPGGIILRSASRSSLKSRQSTIVGQTHSSASSIYNNNQYSQMQQRQTIDSDVQQYERSSSELQRQYSQPQLVKNLNKMTP